MYVMGAANAEVMSGYNVVRRDAPPGYKFQSEPTLEYPRRSPRNAEERHGSAGARRASRRVGLADAIEPPARSRRRWGGWGALGLADAIEPPARSRRRSGGMGGHVGAPHLNGVVGGSRPADDQWPHPWRRLRADRPRLHDGVRHHRADQLRPRRRLHARPLRVALLVHAARRDEDTDRLAAPDDPPARLHPHDAHDRGPQRRDRPRGLPSAPALDPARAAHHGDRRVFLALERGAPLEGPGAHRLPRRPPVLRR